MSVFNVTSFGMGLGGLAFASSVCAILPFVPAFNCSQSSLVNWLKICLKKQNLFWAIALFCGLVHGLVMTQKSDIDFFSIKTYFFYTQGVITLNFLIFLAMTYHEMKEDGKKLNQLAYVAMFLLALHVVYRVALSLPV